MNDKIFLTVVVVVIFLFGFLTGFSKGKKEKIVWIIMQDSWADTVFDLRDENKLTLDGSKIEGYIRIQENADYDYTNDYDIMEWCTELTLENCHFIAVPVEKFNAAMQRN